MNHVLDLRSLSAPPGPAAGGSPWIAFHQPLARARMRLFCFPYAGGGALSFRQWQRQLRPGLEVCAIELPGRGRRALETPFRRMEEAVPVICAAMAPYAEGLPCALFGHSMGALLAFEVARALERAGAADVRMVFASGARAPSRRPVDERSYALPERELIAMLRRLKGTPEALLENAEAMQLVLPCVRADLELAQTYRYTDGEGLRCPIRAFGGLGDSEVPQEDLAAWAEATAGPFSLRMFRGGHFFLADSEAELLGAISGDLEDA